MIWLLEDTVLPELHASMRETAAKLGHEVWAWDADNPPRVEDKRPLVFHGSLNVASDISTTTRQASRLGYWPGGYCHTSVYRCSAYYELARPWLLHQNWWFMTAAEFCSGVVGSRVGSAGRLLKDAGPKLFVRPDSPLKQFSGRVIDLENPCTARPRLEDLDFGFYYDDPNLPIVVAPFIPDLGMEWRFVVVDGVVVAGSGYVPWTRKGAGPAPRDSWPWGMAQEIAREFPRRQTDAYAPLVLDRVYCIDLVEPEVSKWGARLRLVELTPFSGADLYDCDLEAVMRAVEISVNT